jgi:ribonucleotide monophosphatase NagD (HAD superfamily)
VLAAAASAVRAGARFIATNSDATFPTGGPDAATPGAGHAGDDGLLPGAGALVAFVATAAGRQPEVAGKPHPPMATLVRARFGELRMVAGDRPDTDGLFAKLVGARFGLVLSGVTRPADLPVEPTPDLVGDDLLALARQYLAGTRAS